MSSYPKAFSYLVQRFLGLSRQKYRILPSAQTSFGPSDLLVLDLPVGLLSLDTLTLHGKATTAASGGTTPSAKLPSIEETIDSLIVEIGGVQVCSIQNYGQLFEVFRSYQMADRQSFRGCMQLDQPAAALPTNSLQNNVPWAMYNWLGFLGSQKILDTTLLPQVRLYIRFGSTSILSEGGAPTSRSFVHTGVYGSIDVLDIADGVYSKMIQSRLASAPLEVPFQNYTTVVGSLGAPTQSTRFSTSASCLEKILAFPINVNVNDRVHRNTTGLSTFFRRDGTMITDSVFRINSVPYPSIPQVREEVFVGTAHTLNAAQDTVGSSHPNMNTLDNWAADFWTHAVSFTFDADGESMRMCGLDGRGGTITGSWDTNGSGANFQPAIVLCTKSVLRVGPNRTIEVVA